MKYYAVKKGNETGVFDDWGKCSAAVKGFSGAEYKSFPTMEEAKAYLNDEDIYLEQVKVDIGEGYVVAFCDGSFDKELNRYSYGVLAIDLELKEYELCGYANNSKYLTTQNIAGEVLGVINAMDWAVTHGYGKIRIYHDYEGLSKWATGENKANSDIAKAFVSIYQNKYCDLLEVDFKKVKGHSHNKYNDMADELAKSAIEDRRKLVINGGNWFSIPRFKENELRSIIELMDEEYPELSIDESDSTQKLVFKLKLDGYKLTVTEFKSGNKKLLVQGKNDFLFQLFISFILELLGIEQVDPILKDAYRKNIKSDEISGKFTEMLPNLPSGYPNNIKTLLRQSVINLCYYVESEDYGQYAYPALRALEGHIKYMLGNFGYIITIKTGFFMFDKVQNTNNYILPQNGKVTDADIKMKIEKCYNYYYHTRNTTFHFGDIIGLTDSSRMIVTKQEADDIIKECIELIGE